MFRCVLLSRQTCLAKQLHEANPCVHHLAERKASANAEKMQHSRQMRNKSRLVCPDLTGWSHFGTFCSEQPLPSGTWLSSCCFQFGIIWISEKQPNCNLWTCALTLSSHGWQQGCVLLPCHRWISRCQCCIVCVRWRRQSSFLKARGSRQCKVDIGLKPVLCAYEAQAAVCNEVGPRQASRTSGIQVLAR